MKNIIDMLNAALDELRTTLIERDRTIREQSEYIGSLQNTIGDLRAQANAPTAPLDFQRLFERVLALEHDVDVMKENIRHERN